jgi:hypothetical protein
MRIGYVTALALAGAIGCSEHRSLPSGVDEHLAKVEMALEEVDQGVYQLFVTKDALANGTEFLLSTSTLRSDVGEPNFAGMLSRVVTFKHADGKVQMLESPKGAAVDPALTPANVIASFPIVSETESALGLNFNEGAASALLAFDWTSSDSDDAHSLFRARFYAAQLSQRYVDEGRTDAAGRITIRQVAQLDFGDGAASTLELRYFLRPYTPDPAYQPLVSKQDFRWAGYFESGPSLIQGTASAQRFVSRFNPNRPLVYAISANTPADVKEAIRDGILYWNRVSGFDWIQVVDAPEGVTAPNLDYNLVQWVQETGATFAYADAQLDPLTGEVQNAQVYFPSGWYDNAETFVVDAYAQLKKRTLQGISQKLARARQAQEGGDSLDEPAAPGARKVGACARVDSRVFDGAAKAMLKRGLSPEQVQRAALDWVRSALSHEVGHTLGLRHNFAGSLGTDIAPDEIDALMERYYQSGEWPADKQPGSSTMEYPEFEDDLAIGAWIRLGYPGLAHDVVAIDHLYNGAPLRDGGPLFCSDTEESLTVDCSAFDRGADRILSARREIGAATEDAAVRFLSSLRGAKEAGALELFRDTDPSFDAARAHAVRYEVALLLTDQSRLLAADRALGSPTINEREIHADSLARVGRSIEAAGGYADFFPLLPEGFERRFHAQLRRMLANPWYTSGLASDGQRWAFSEGELEQIEAYVPRYLARYREAAAQADVDVLSLQDPLLGPALSGSSDDIFSSDFGFATAQWEAPVAAEELEALLAERALYYVSATSGSFGATVSVAAVEEGAWPGGEDVPEGESDEQGAGGESEPEGDAEPPATTLDLELPIFQFPTSLRAQAPDLLSSSQSADRIWARDTRRALAERIFQVIDEAAGGSFDALQLDGSDPAAQRWILDQQDVLRSAPGFP